MAFRYSLEAATEANSNYRKVVYTDRQMQLVLMCLNRGESIPEETHDHGTQFFRMESGKIRVLAKGKEYRLGAGDSLIIPAHTKHTITQMGDEPARFYTLYSPPEHAPDRLDKRQP